MLLCLTSTFRSRGFAPSQRLLPAWALQLCFAPLPPVGLRSSEPSPPSQPHHLSTFVPLMPLARTPDFRVLFRLGIRSYALTCYSKDAADALLTFSLSEAHRSERWLSPPLLCFRTLSRRKALTALQGIKRFELGWNFGSSADLHEFLHLVRGYAYNCVSRCRCRTAGC